VWVTTTSPGSHCNGAPTRRKRECDERPAPDWYPDPRPGTVGLQAYWDGAQWQLGATKRTETAEWVAIVVGLVGGPALCTIFPPAIVFVLGLVIWWYFYDQQKKKRIAGQAQWYREQGAPPR
jgi:hypothetical protein